MDSTREEWEQFTLYKREAQTFFKILNFDYLRIDSEFWAVVKGMFNSGVDDETKKVLAKINSMMREIQSLQ